MLDLVLASFLGALAKDAGTALYKRCKSAVLEFLGDASSLSDIDISEIKAGVKELSRKLIGGDDTSSIFLRQAIERGLTGLVADQKDRLLLLQLTAERLKENPPSAEEATQGPDILDKSFLKHLRARVHSASEQEIRDKWAEVLAAEIRKPGTFSPKIMRILDEIDKKKAELFREICQHRIGTVIPKCFLRDAAYVENILFGEGLLLEQFKGIIFTSDQVLRDDKGVNVGLSIAELNKNILAVSRDAPVKRELISAIRAREPIALNYTDDGYILGRDPDKIIPAFQLSRDGMALASICLTNIEKNFQTYVRTLSAFLPHSMLWGLELRSVLIGKKLSDGRSWFFRS